MLETLRNELHFVRQMPLALANVPPKPYYLNRSDKGRSPVTDAFDRLKSALADRYTIERELGSGGMATV